MPRGKPGRPVLGAFAGFFFGLFVAVDLLLFGVIALDSVLVIVLPIVGLIVGVGVPLIRRAIARRPQEMRDPALEPYIPPPAEPPWEEPPVPNPPTTDPPAADPPAATDEGTENP